jgi:dTDP-4-amino-4,6-dideoxygalactose transaminase
VWAQYSVLAKDHRQRERIQSALKDQNIPTAIYYPKPLHLQTAFAVLGYAEGDFPASEDASQRIFSLPMHPYLTIEEQQHVADIIGKSK